MLFHGNDRAATRCSASINRGEGAAAVAAIHGVLNDASSSRRHLTAEKILWLHY
jgi:hypothetical protein